MTHVADKPPHARFASDVEATIDSARSSAAPQTDFRNVFEENAAYVCQLVRRLGIPERDIEDVAHDVFVAVHRRLSDYDPALAIRPWLSGITFRMVVAHRRRKSNQQQPIEAPLEIADIAPLADEQIEVKDRRDLVLAALSGLSDEKRIVFVLHELEGLAMPEIAQGLAIPINTAYSRLRVAREEFVNQVRRLKKQAGDL